MPEAREGLIRVNFHCLCGRAWRQDLAAEVGAFDAQIRAICCPSCGAGIKTKVAGRTPKIMMGEAKEVV